MYEIFVKVWHHMLLDPPLSQTVTSPRTPLERDVLYGRPGPFNVSVTLIDKIYNFALNSTHMQQLF